MSESALDRTARALDLVPYLLEHQGISVSELAQVFGVTEKQINSDLILIHMCGLPGYTPLELIEMYYEDGYVTVSDPQSLNKPRNMNRTEITSLLVSLDLLKSTRSDSISEEIEKLKLKLQKSLSIENPFVVVSDSKISSLVEQIEFAIAKGKALEIVYLSGSKDESTERLVLPLDLYQQNSYTYLNAWCQTSEGERTFRLDRLISLKVSETKKIGKPNGADKARHQTANIELIVSKSARNFIEENRGVIESIVGEDVLRVFLHPIDLDWLSRTILGYGSAIKVVGPAQLAEDLTARAKAIRQLYPNSK
jgi:proteasome accessory factor C